MSDFLRDVLTFLFVKLPRLWSDWRYRRECNPLMAQRLRREARH